MFALVLNVAFSVGFGHVIKWSSRRGANVLWVGACNYIAAALACAAITLFLPPTYAVPFTVATGAWVGVAYLVSLLYYFAAIDRVGVGLSTSTNRLSVALPVAAALLLWHEALRPEQTAGLLLVALALALMGRTGHGGRGSTGVLLGLLLPFFLITGVGQLGARIFSGGAPAANTFLFLTCLFGGAAVSALVALGVSRASFRRRDWWMGALLGGVNLIANLTLLAALRVLPSAVVFSVGSASGVVLATLSSLVLWRERPGRAALCGVAVSAVAVVLLTQ